MATENSSAKTGAIVFLFIMILAVVGLGIWLMTSKTAKAATANGQKGGQPPVINGGGATAPSGGGQQVSNPAIVKLQALHFANSSAAITKNVKAIMASLQNIPDPMYQDTLAPVTDGNTLNLYWTMWLSYFCGKQGGNWGWVDGSGTYWADGQANSEFLSTVNGLKNAGDGGIIPTPNV